MTPAERIISKFGSIRGMARRLGHRHPTTVQGWLRSGLVPAHHMRAVIDAGADLADPISAADFVPDEDAIRLPAKKV